MLASPESRAKKETPLLLRQTRPWRWMQAQQLRRPCTHAHLSSFSLVRWLSMAMSMRRSFQAMANQNLRGDQRRPITRGLAPAVLCAFCACQ